MSAEGKSPTQGRFAPTLALAAGAGAWTWWLAREPGLLQGLDYVRYYSLNAGWFRRSLLAGDIPWWNPHIALGRPFLADLQTGVFYPPHLLFALGDVGTMSVVLTALHLALAAWGMKRLCEAIGASPPMAALAGLALIMSPAFSARVASGQVHYVAALAYLPVLLWRTVELVRASRRGVPAAILALLAALQLLCGHPQVFWITAVGAVVLALVAAAAGGWRDALRCLGWLAVAYALGLALTAPVLLPFLELITESNRTAAAPDMSRLGAMAARDWLGLVLPPMSRFVPDIEALVLVGLPAAAAAEWAAWRGRRDQGIRAFVAVSVAAAILASSVPAWLHQAFALLLPGFSSFRMPSRTAVLVVVALLVLAARAVSLAPHRRVLRWSGVALTFLTLLAAAPALRQWYVLPAEYPGEPVVAGLVRELQTTDPARVPPRLNISARLVRENSGMVTGHSSFNAYTSLYLARVWAFVHAAAGLPEPPVMNTFPDVRIFMGDPFFSRAMGLVGGFDPATKEFRLAASPDPRAYLCFATAAPLSWREAVAAMAAGHDFHRVALVESDAGVLNSSTDLPGSATIVGFANERVRIRTQASAAATLVLAEAWYPGWEVTVNGAPARAFPVNGWMRGVHVPAGEADVEWRFRQRWFRSGCVIGFAALAMIGVLFFRGRRTAA